MAGATGNLKAAPGGPTKPEAAGPATAAACGHASLSRAAAAASDRACAGRQPPPAGIMFTVSGKLPAVIRLESKH